MKIHRHTIPARGRTPCDRTDAAEIKVWGPRAIATVLWEIGTQFELATGYQLDIDSALADCYVERLNSDQRFDVLIGTPPLVDGLIEHGKVAADSRTMLVRSPLGVEVRAGAVCPDVSSVEAFKRTLLAAKSIAYLQVGGGVHIAAMIERLGIANELAPKVIRPTTDIVSDLVANGDVELGMVVATQILTTSGVQLVGLLPSELQSYLVFVGGVGARSEVPGAARALLKFLTGPTAAPVIKAQGMEPYIGDGWCPGERDPGF